jgi:alkylation response protein AidB-like acyl-CoA dehydrogenase
MQIDATTDLAGFRQQVRDWIAEHTPKGLAQLTDWTRLMRGGGEWWSYRDEMATDAYQEWDRLMTEEKLVCGHWPVAYGGRELTTEQCRVLDQECLRANVPRVFREQGEAWVGPSILAHGTEEQKARLLPRIVSGEDRYTQGFSEPDHGSDLASLETKGVVDGDRIFLTGQKVWTSGALFATQIFVLCRTDPYASRKHAGISYVIMDIAENPDTLRFRPIRQLTGESEFCETFLDGASAPLSNVIGGLNNGWSVAMTTLANERVGRAAAARNASYRKDFTDLLAVARANGKSSDPEVRRLVVRLYTTLAVLDRWSTPGVRTVHQSVAKLVSSEWEQRFGELALEVLGEDAAVLDQTGEYELNRWQRGYLRSLSATIASGSSEIQRNVIAERVLGLPREASLVQQRKVV